MMCEIISAADILAENAALRRWAKAWKSSARLHLAEAEYTGKEYICMAEACNNEKLRAAQLEADNAVLRERVAELEQELWNCRQSLTPPQKPEDATYYPIPKSNTTYWDGEGVA